MGNDSSVLFWIPRLCSQNALSMYDWFGQYIDMREWDLLLCNVDDGRCRTCKFIALGTSSYTFYNTGKQCKIPHSLSCSSDNLIYLINCKRCIKKIPLSHVNILAKPVVHWENVLGNTDEVSKITLTNQFPFTLINPSIP